MNIIFELLLSAVLLVFWMIYFSVTFFFNNVKYRYISFSIIILYTIWIFYRIINTGFAPFSNLYESIMFFGFLYSIKILLMIKHKKLSGILSIGGIILILVSIFMPIKNKIITDNLPSLYSFWLYIHVPLIFNLYRIFITTYIIYYCSSRKDRQKKNIT